MPFIEPKDRTKLENGFPCEEVGEICYLAYNKMITLWKDKPSWTTWSKIRYKVYNDPMSLLTNYQLEQCSINFSQNEILNQIEAAKEIFYTWYVVDYEKKKEQKNGRI